ncbi:MAG: tRNA 2-thiouridine(34) synthase MnmA [Alphaproteobacteria bacterium]|nr:tRNA 2-thiouridine(34) synthase MnmA [Alphaproteobacteria bacterium]OJV13848.1 MAG: tRNA 2-thiouridine(34) synthase MnmA [Alphaproteobacteria bacterium 33-17]
MLTAPHLTKPIRDTKIIVAMSGGVDSSVVAALLHEAGYQVIGVTLQLYDLAVTLEKKGACCAGQDIYDAKNVADKIGFPHYVLNYESLFKESVIEEFADSYMNGETPIPCVKCNQSVKFRDLLKVAKDLGADGLATGHYIQKTYINNEPVLLKGNDETKDQSYFLFATTKEQLNYTFFPLGHMNKTETREHAARFGLDVANKSDSQDICFVPNGDYASVISKLRPGALDAGDIVDMEGKVLGRHTGIINYTIGQRKGLGIAAANPLYVVKIDAENKKVIVGSEDDLKSKNFFISGLNWLGITDFPEEGLDCFVKLRSTHKGAHAHISKTDDNKYKVTMFDPERAVTPGQACVMYDENKVLGGGWITRDHLK